MSAVAAITGLSISDAAGRTLLDRIELDLADGQVTGLLGESGAGKTTLALALLGHLGPGLRTTAGHVRVAGLDPFTAQHRRMLRRRVTSYLPQDTAAALDPARTVAAQLRTAARTAHAELSRSARTELVTQAAADAALEPELLHRRPAQLSGGQAQRALLAWTFVTRPRLLILDEPTSGLDPATALHVSSTFAALPWNPAVLLISHDRDLIARVSDQTLHLTAGRLTPPPAVFLSTPPVMPRAHATATAEVLAMDAVTIRRGTRTLLNDAALRLCAGELLAIRGRSGSGKTTLARALCGLTRPQTGTLAVHGTDVPWDAGARARTGGPFIAYVGQDARGALNPREPATRTLTRAVHSARRAGRPAPSGGLEDLLARVGLAADVLPRTPDRLSGGQRHRLALARALAAGPDVLVCDETTAALDAATADRILDTLDRVRHDTDLPILLITHQDAVAARADRVLTLEEGRLT